MKKLTLSYYPYLILVFSFYAIVGYPFTLKELISQFAYLSMFIRIDGLGQMWFLTMIIICYILYILISNLLKKKYFTIFDILLSIGILSLITIGDLAGIRGIKLLIWIPWSITLFLFADKILNRIYSYKRITAILFFLIINTSTILILSTGLFNSIKLIEQLLCILCGASWIILFAAFDNTLKPNAIISYMASISYEIYLVHFIFCIGHYKIANYFSPEIAFMLVLISSICLAAGLNYINRFLSLRI